VDFLDIKNPLKVFTFSCMLLSIFAISVDVFHIIGGLLFLSMTGILLFYALLLKDLFHKYVKPLKEVKQG
jgi:hypothetical protein